MNPFYWTEKLIGGIFFMKVTEEELRRELEIAVAGQDSQPNCAFRLGIGLNTFKALLPDSANS